MIDLCEMMHNQYIEIYITIVSLIVYSSLHYCVLVMEVDGKGFAGSWE